MKLKQLLSPRLGALSASWLLALTLLAGCAGSPPPVEGPDIAAVEGVQLADDGSHRWQDYDWVDDSRQRAVPVRIYWPESAAPPSGWPVIVFSHGLGGSRRGYSYLGRYWASQGVVALHVQHIGSDRRLWGGDSRLALVLRLRQAAQPGEAIGRTQDMRYALDRLLQGPLASRIDPHKIAVAGHSYGANTSLLLAGARIADPQRFDSSLPLADMRDPRIKAAILISAPPFYGEGDPAPIVGSIAIPTLHITATEDEITIPGYYSDAADRVQLFNAIGGRHKALALFSGGSHSIFTDRLNTGGETLNPQVKAATRELSVAFLRQVMDGQSQPLREWQQRHASLLTRWQAP